MSFAVNVKAIIFLFCLRGLNMRVIILGKEELIIKFTRGASKG